MLLCGCVADRSHARSRGRGGLRLQEYINFSNAFSFQGMAQTAVPADRRIFAPFPSCPDHVCMYARASAVTVDGLPQGRIRRHEVVRVRDVCCGGGAPLARGQRVGFFLVSDSWEFCFMLLREDGRRGGKGQRGENEGERHVRYDTSARRRNRGRDAPHPASASPLGEG